MEVKRERRPIPPTGFIFFKWKTKKDSISLCPNCGGTKGYGYTSGGWTDPIAQKAYDDGIADGIRLCGAGDTSITYEDMPILLHWTRFGTGECLACGVKLWNDFVGHKWHNYYKPTKGQLGLF